MTKLSGDSKINRKVLAYALALICLGVFLRLAPHPANFAPIGAIALIGGATIKGRYSLFVPLAAIVISDLFIGMHDTILFTWGSFALIALLSSKTLAKRLNLENVLIGGLASALIFFIITNFGVWLVSSSYEASLAGLMNSYYQALPFLRNTLLSDLMYSAVLYGAYVYAVRYLPRSSTILRSTKIASV